MVKYYQIEIDMDIKDENDSVRKQVASTTADVLKEELDNLHHHFSSRIHKALKEAGRQEVVFDINSLSKKPKEPKLFFSLKGQAELVASSRKQYPDTPPANFIPDSNSYKLLHHFAANPKRSFTIKDLEKVFGDSTTQRLILDTIKEIRGKFQLAATSPDDFFIDTRKRYGINCIVEITD